MTGTPRAPRRHWLKEPLLHFSAVGLALFALHHAFARPPVQTIVVSPSFVEGLRREHEERTGKRPTPEEERALVDRFVDEEVLVREALSLGLDRGDVIVRRRLLQKMELVMRGLAPEVEATDAQLDALRKKSPERYVEPVRTSLRHVFFDGARRGERVTADAEAARARLAAGADPGVVGDPFLQGATFAQRAASDLEGLFGSDAARAIASLPLGAWSGPVASPLGVHLFFVEGRFAPGAADLARVRDVLRRDFAAERMDQRGREALGELRARYRVEVSGAAVTPPPQPKIVARQEAR